MPQILNQQLQNFRAHIDEIVKNLHDLTLKIGHEELAHTVSDLRNRIKEPFMFVIVGEVKAGKSSFVNALLATGREITKVAPQPMTDTVQQIVWGETEEIITLNPYLKQIRQPVEILKEIAIVDTPGTNTIVAHHQEITERFVPASDLIVFVFEAKNPYRQSAWDFFDYIHKDWRKKIIFVLQQKDLLNASDLAVNEKGVYDNAVKKGIQDPLVFSVSAKLEQEQDDEELSGFAGIRAYIRDNITGGKAPVLKLQNNIATSLNVNERIGAGIDTRKQQWEADIYFRKDIKETLDNQELRSKKQVDTLIGNMLAGYDNITMKKEQELRDELSFFTLLRRSFASIFTKDASAKNRLEDLAKSLETDLNKELQNKLDNGVGALADSIQQMAKLIDLKIQNSQTILKNNHAIFSDIADRRANVLGELQEAFKRFLDRTENFRDDDLFPHKQSLAPNLMTGGGIAIIGTIISAVTTTAVIDITGYVLTSVGILFAGISTTFQKRKIMNGFQGEVAKGRTQLETELNEKLKTYVGHIKERIDANFSQFDDLLEEEGKEVNRLKDRQLSIESELKNMQASIT